MRQGRLNDAAIALTRILRSHGIAFGMFGGGAVAILGGPRESKDLDILAVCSSKRTLVQYVNGKEGFRFTGNTREDLATFLWSDNPNTQQWVLVEVFLCNSQIRRPNQMNIRGEALGNGSTFLLDPVYLFKGKLRACANRDKFSDASDLGWLESHFRQELQNHRNNINLRQVGVALKRYPHLSHVFQRIGLDLERAQQAASRDSISRVEQHYVGDVQRGLLN
ncbi:MAG: hypothetical protein M1831_001309 [Alyxoria varia]|nr:MAG: hypothetical protein M1831_001309 [Alyxoria varia]